MEQGLKELIRAEYETDPIVTIDELCDRYRISKHILGQTSDWEKIQHIDEPEVLPTEVLPTKTTKDLILECKNLTIDEVLTRLKTQGSMLAIKDLKELSAIVDTIDRSYNKTTDLNQINIVIQNMISKFEDDC